MTDTQIERERMRSRSEINRFAYVDVAFHLSVYMRNGVAACVTVCVRVLGRFCVYREHRVCVGMVSVRKAFECVFVCVYVCATAISYIAVGSGG